MASLGILGGTFNPPHVGHLACAQAAMAQLGLDRVALMPAWRAVHKSSEEDPGPEHRLAMCRAAVKDADGLEASALEVERGRESYTVDTLRALKQAHPHDELTFIVGADMALELGSWREPEQVLALARVAVAPRAGTLPADVDRTLLALGAGAGRVTHLDMPEVAVSSSQIRAWLAAGRSVDDLLPESVGRYIADHGLYGTAGDGP